MSTPAEPERLTVEKHFDFQKSLAGPDRDYDEIDAFLEEQQDAQDAMSDPLRDHLPQQATNRKAKGVLNILDQLDAEQVNSNRRLNR